MSTDIPTKTITKTHTQTVNGFIIRRVDVILGERADCMVELTYKSDPSSIPYPITVIQIVIEGDDYKAWGTDDTYISTYVSNYIQNMS